MNFAVQALLELCGAILVVIGVMLLVHAIGYTGPNNFEGLRQYKDATRFDVRP